MQRHETGYRGYRDLKVYQMAYQLALDIHEVTKTFPKEEKYSQSSIQNRFRFAYKENKLFCLVDFISSSQRDVARIYLTKDQNNTPIIITADLQEQKAVVSGRKEAALRALVKGSKMELEIPLDSLDLKNTKTVDYFAQSTVNDLYKNYLNSFRNC